MEVEMSACLYQPPGTSSICSSSADGRSVSFKSPATLAEASFPISDASFPTDHVYGPSPTAADVYNSQLSNVAQNMMTESQNAVIYAYGQKALPKRQFLFGTSKITETLGSDSGVLQHIFKSLFSCPLGDSIIKVHAFVLGVTDNIVDLLNIDNTSACISDSIKDGPSILNLSKREIRSYSEAVAALKTIAANIEEEYVDVMDESREKDPFPPYNPSNCLVGIMKYADREAAESGTDCNSIYVVSLGDSERPPLCGINLDQLNKYEKTHKSHSSLIAVLGAIRCNRLRVPFTKSKLTLLMRRTYNQEKSNPQNELNKPTKTFAFIWVFSDGRHAEETVHSLTTAKRICNVMGGSNVGPSSRDLNVEKWRLEQDILELKDELTIAKAVHDYKPCIFDQAKPVQNIQEEEFKRINAINKKREDARAKAQAEMRAQAQKEAEVIIKQEEMKSNNNLQELEERMKIKLAQNAELSAEREKKVKEFDKQLDKIRKKKLEEEEKANKLKEEIKAIEDELAARHAAIDKAKQQLDLLHMDRARGQEFILQGREEAKENRQKIYSQRKAQREQWIADIEDTNAKVLEQVRLLEKERAAAGIGRITTEDISEREVCKDIEAVRNFLPKLLDIDNPRQENAASEKIRLQLEDYFETEKRNFERKLAEEEQRKKDLEKAAEMYKTKLHEYQVKLKKDQLQEALRKERHLEGLVEQVVQYLEHGCTVTKIPSKGVARKRYYYISNDRKRLCCCELEDIQNVMSRRKPPTVFFLKDIKRIILGQYTAQFLTYGKGGKRLGELDDQEGAYNPNNTEPVVTAQNLSRYFYRSFSFEFKKGKTLDLITDTDSDFEAWIVALKRLLGNKVEWEKVLDDRKGAAVDPPPPIEWGEPLDVNGRPGADGLAKDELRLCMLQHITPMQYLNAKEEVLQKAQSSFITVYDVRTLSSLDLPRAQEVHEFFLNKKLIIKCADQGE